jgi:hypothetical protein
VLPLTAQVNLPGLSRASPYPQPRGPASDEVVIKHRIGAIDTEHRSYGSRRIVVQLRRDGPRANRKAIRRHMREMRIAGVGPAPNPSRRNGGHRVYPYPLRDVTSAYPHHVWDIEIVFPRDAAGEPHPSARVLDVCASKGGKRGPAGPCVGSRGEPGGRPSEVERRADRQVVECRLRQPDIPRAAQAAGVHALRDRPLDAGPRGVLRRERRCALPVMRGLVVLGPMWSRIGKGVL